MSIKPAVCQNVIGDLKSSSEGLKITTNWQICITYLRVKLIKISFEIILTICANCWIIGENLKYSKSNLRGNNG